MQKNVTLCSYGRITNKMAVCALCSSCLAPLEWYALALLNFGFGHNWQEKVQISHGPRQATNLHLPKIEKKEQFDTKHTQKWHMTYKVHKSWKSKSYFYYFLTNYLLEKYEYWLNRKSIKTWGKIIYFWQKIFL